MYADDKENRRTDSLAEKITCPGKKSHNRPPLDAGTERNPKNISPLQNEFPFTYKIAEGQIIENDSVLHQGTG